MIDEKFLEGIGIIDKDTVQTEAYAADIKAEQNTATAVQTQLNEASKTPFSPTKTWALTASRRA